MDLRKLISSLSQPCFDDSESEDSWEDCNSESDDSDESESEEESGVLAFQRAMQSFMLNHMADQVSPQSDRRPPLRARRTLPKADTKASKELKERLEKRRTKRQKIEAVKNLVDLSKMDGVRKVAPKVKEADFLTQLMKKPHLFFPQ